MYTGGRFGRSGGIVAVTWCVAAFFFVNIYSSCLTSYMSLTFQKPDIVTFKDLANMPSYKVLTIKFTTPDRLFTVRNYVC